MTTPLGQTGSKPAPGGLALVQAFVNTADLETGRDALATPEGLRAWLGQNGLLDAHGRAKESDRRRAIAVREALRGLLLVNAGVLAADATRAHVATIEEAAERGPLVVRFGEDGATRLEPAGGGVDGALGRLLAVVHDARVEGTWDRLKACRNDDCHWAFYDHSKNRSGTWCTMAACGSRLKSRAYRQRQTAAEDAVTHHGARPATRGGGTRRSPRGTDRGASGG